MIDNEKYLAAFFGRQHDYYLEKYKYYHGGVKFTFNIGAFFGGILWFLYRKLFLHAFGIFLLFIIFSIIEGLIFDTLQVSSEFQKLEFLISNFLFATIFGFTGNYFYIKQAEKKITEIISGTESEDECINSLKKNGGVSWTAIIVVVFTIAFLTLILISN
jgi:hypothetical protein